MFLIKKKKNFLIKLKINLKIRSLGAFFFCAKNILKIKKENENYKIAINKHNKGEII